VVADEHRRRLRHSPAPGSLRPVPVRLPASAPKGRPKNPATAVSGVRRLTDKWVCVSCRKAMGPQWVAEGKAEIVDGGLTCIECARYAERKAKRTAGISKNTIFTTAATVLAVIAVAGVFFPDLVFFLLLLTGVTVLLTGILGTPFARRTRLIVVFAGLAGTMAAGWAFSGARDRTQSQRSEKAMLTQASAVRELLKQDCFWEARLRWEAFERGAKNPAGAYQTEEAGRESKAIAGLLNEWERANFGSLSTLEHELLMQLFARFSSVTATGVRRFQRFHSDGINVTLSAVAESASAAPISLTADSHVPPERIAALGSAAQIKEASELILFLHQRSPKAESIVITLLAPDAKRPGEELETYRANQATLKELEQGKLSALKKD